MELTGFALRDRTRRALGRRFEELGWGPRETPSRVVFSTPGVRLKEYRERGAGPVLLLVPAPIKRAYIWDLAPGASVVRRAQAAGCRVFLLEWGAPGEAAGGLADYADRMLGACVEAVAVRTGEARVFIAGHSLGGTLAAIFATLHGERVRGLVLLGAPLHFDAGSDVFAPLLARADLAQLAAGEVPGSFLNAVTFMAAPLTIGWAPWLDRCASLADRGLRDTLMRVNRWAHDEMPLAGRLVAEVVQRLYREDALMRGTLTIGGRRADPTRLDAPVLGVADPRCALVPPSSVAPFLDAVASADVQLIAYHGDRGVLLQHVGMLVGRAAHRELWPRILDWLHTRARGAN